jgi:hypothetical protein
MASLGFAMRTGRAAHKIAEGEAPWGLRNHRRSRATERLQALSMWPWRRGRRKKWNSVWRLVASPITGSVDVGMSFRRLTMRLLSAAGDPSGPLNNFLGTARQCGPVTFRSRC